MDITMLTDNGQRASFYFDNAGRPVEDILHDVEQSVSDYLDAHGNPDKLPEELCGAVCATVAAINLYGIATTPNVNVFTALNALSEASWHANHAVEHGDAMATEVFTPQGEDDNVDAVVERLRDWVLANLPESDPDAFLASLTLEASVTEGDA